MCLTAPLRLTGLFTLRRWQRLGRSFGSGLHATLHSHRSLHPRFASPKNAKQNAERIRYLKRLLANTDYIAVKIAEGAATAADYADKIAQRQAWREEIQQLETIS
ncbi:MAG: hypothetical protein LBO67_05365 [Spirochaetaceae bacterium]|nr:hypothetical protein [Spirochaetaceae bacterium]